MIIEDRIDLLSTLSQLRIVVINKSVNKLKSINNFLLFFQFLFYLLGEFIVRWASNFVESRIWSTICDSVFWVIYEFETRWRPLKINLVQLFTITDPLDRRKVFSFWASAKMNSVYIYFFFQKTVDMFFFFEIFSSVQSSRPVNVKTTSLNAV